MSLSLYEISVPVMIKGFRHLAKQLELGRAHAEATGLAPEALLGARLIEDMLPLTAQVQRASDTARFLVTRVTGLPAAPMADNETTFEEVQARIAATIAYLEGVPAAAFEGREEADASFDTRAGRRVFTGRSYVLEFGLPNYFFHITTAYGVLRHKGVPVGKADFLGWR